MLILVVVLGLLLVLGCRRLLTAGGPPVRPAPMRSGRILLGLVVVLGLLYAIASQRLSVPAGTTTTDQQPRPAGPSAGQASAAAGSAATASQQLARQWHTFGADPLVRASAVITAAALTEASADCLAQAAAAAADDCEGALPVLVIGGDLPQISEFDRTALTGHPQWHVLNRVQSDTAHPGISRRWYEQDQWRAVTDGACEPSARTTTTAPAQCQEFPFWSASQGGPVSGPPARVALLSGSQNQAEGGWLSAFYARCVAVGSPFVVVASSHPDVPTFSVCPPKQSG